MGRRLLIVLLALGMLTALALVSGAAGSPAGAKYKIKVTGGIACLGPCDSSSIVVTMVGENRKCVPFAFTDQSCNFWTARAGTKVVLKTTAGNQFVHHVWGGDCTGQGDCKLTMDSNKSVFIVWLNA